MSDSAVKKISGAALAAVAAAALMTGMAGCSGIHPYQSHHAQTKAKSREQYNHYRQQQQKTYNANRSHVKAYRGGARSSCAHGSCKG